MEMKRPQPQPDPDSAGFWAATAEGLLKLRRCKACRLWHHPPLERCRRCGEATAWEPVSGNATLYSFIVVHRSAIAGFDDLLPYVIGLVELAEQPGLRLSSRLVDIKPEEAKVGMPLKAVIVDHPGGSYRVPVFAPAA